MSTTIYYIAPHRLSPLEFKKNINKIPAFIEISTQDRIMSVLLLKSNIRNRFFGSTVFLHACKEQIKKGITIVELDDCSSHYRQPHNIYIKLGLKYVADCYPEMVGNIEEILSLVDIDKLDFSNIYSFQASLTFKSTFCKI